MNITLNEYFAIIYSLKKIDIFRVHFVNIQKTMEDDEEFVREPDEQRSERLIDIPNYHERTRFESENRRFLNQNRSNRRRRRRGREPSEFITTQLPYHHTFNDAVSMSIPELEAITTLSDTNLNDDATTDARIEYRYDSPPSDGMDLEKAIQESLKTLEETEKVQNEFLQKEEMEEENRFMEEQLKLIQEQEEEERLQREHERKMEAIQKKYGIMMGIMRRSSQDSMEYAFYLVWTDWFEHHSHETLKIKEEMKEWLHQKRNLKLFKMLQEDELL